MQLLTAVKSAGSYAPDECLHYVEEMMTAAEIRKAEAFLKWVVANDRDFGHGNIEQVYAEFQKGSK